MIAVAQRNLRVIDGLASDWIEKVNEEIQNGTNFLLMLPNHPEATAEFCKVFELGEDCELRVLSRPALFSLSRFIDPKDFDYLFAAEERGDKVLLLEQLDLVRNRPPHVKPYLVYSPTWGIISQHDQLSPAREDYHDYLNSLVQPQPHDEAGIYKWTGKKWAILGVR